jgi:site-specific DNA-methyltransferase (adenine-specific)
MDGNLRKNKNEWDKLGMYDGGWKIDKEQKELPEGRFPANIMFECICDELIDGKEIKGNENYNWNNTDTESNTFSNRGTYTPRTETPKIHTNPNCPCYMLDEQSGIKKSIKRGEKYNKEYDNTNTATKLTPGKTEYTDGNTYADKGGASRFFYSAKVSKKERDMNMNGENKEQTSIGSTYAGNQTTSKLGGNPDKPTEPKKNNHPTVKPIALMEYLIKMVTPKGGVVMDCFMGSGSTGIAAKNLGFNFIGIEKEEEYMEIAKQRINYED